jgi:DUF4097 and DUF4098 domain-containing protein YvlB
MSRTKKTVLIVAGIALVCLIGAGIVLGAYYAGSGHMPNFFGIFLGSRVAVDETHPLNLAGISGITVDFASGNVKVVAGSEPKVSMTGRLWTPKEQDEYLKVEKKDGKLAISLDLEESFFSWMDIDVTVTIPEDSGLDMGVSCASADITLQQLKLSDVTVSCASGNLTVNGCSGGKLAIETASGNVNMERSVFEIISATCVSGDVDIRDTEAASTVRCTSGHVAVTDVQGALDISNTSGDVTVSLGQQKISPIDIDVTSGSIHLFLNAEAAFDLDASTTSGGIECGFDRLVSGGSSGPAAGDHIAGKCNGGGVPVTLRTVSGGIDITQQ